MAGRLYCLDVVITTVFVLGTILGMVLVKFGGSHSRSWIEYSVDCVLAATGEYGTVFAVIIPRALSIHR